MKRGENMGWEGKRTLERPLVGMRESMTARREDGKGWRREERSGHRDEIDEAHDDECLGWMFVI